jgi:D-arabinose 1-dehydrogenase-like Zn-dependent alcohol dehydrogenase
LQPQGFFDFLQIGGTQVELPAVIAVFGLKSDCGGLSKQQLSIFAIVGNNIKIVGSTLGNRVDLAETFELQAAGKTKVITEVTNSNR